VAILYTISIDWSNNGTWTNVGEDVTTRTLQELSVTYGRNMERALNPVATGSANLELLNTSRDYSPENSGSPLVGNILPARPLRIQAATILNSNPAFDENTTGWSASGSSTLVRSSTFARSGTTSGKLTSDAALDPRAEGTQAAVSPSTSYQYTGHLYSPIGLPTNVAVGVNWYTSAPAYISTSQTSVTITTGQWTNVTATATSPGTAAFGQIVWKFQGTPGAGAVLYGDDMYLTPAMTTMFMGHMDEYKVLPERGERSVQITAQDALAKLKEARVTTDLYEIIRTGDAVTAVLDAIGWSGSLRDIDSGATIMRWWVVDGDDAYTALTNIMAAEGSPSLITVDSSGSIVFRDRHHRFLLTASTTSQATFRDTGSEPLLSAPLEYDQGWSDIVNDVSFDVDERNPESALGVVWSSELSYFVPNGTTYTIVAASSDPFYGMITPVSGTDYQLRSGSVNVTISRTQGLSTIISIAATGDSVIDGLQVRGYLVPVSRTVRATASDSTSITAYGRKAGPEDAGAASLEDAKAIAALAVAYRKDPLPIVTFDVVGATGLETRLTQNLARDLSDRITVVEAELGLNRAFFVENLTHRVREAGLVHVTSYGCEAVSTNSALDDPSTIFTFDHATRGKFGTGRFAT
jgi:hypothetical protein